MDKCSEWLFQSLRGVMMIRALYQCGDVYLGIGLELFHRMVLPIVKYGSEVWMLDRGSTTEILIYST